MDLNAVPMIKKLSHLPVIVDPSHGTGYAWMVPNLAKAALAVGADGLLIEVHYRPEDALCDGQQSLSPAEFDQLMRDLAVIAPAVGREIKLHEPALI
jgi:3-deoxy-7-phosphoheptulonate synthase